MKRPNILLIMTDQMRGDCLGAAGHPDVKTPHLDTLAAQGLLFPNAYSACPSCIPARAALHTGLSQRSTGRVGYQDGVDWNYPNTLAGELAAAGYYTKCVGKMHVHPLRSRLGYHHVELHDGYLGYYRSCAIPAYESQTEADDYFRWLRERKGAGCDVTDTGIGVNAWTARPWIYEEETHPTNWVTARCLDFFRTRDTREPFFLTASYVRPHPPFDAPACYFDQYRGARLRAPAGGDWTADFLTQNGGRIHDSDTGPQDPALVREAQIGYYACITHLDHQIGRLLYALEERGLKDDTVILFTSDHGELLCDHGLFRKARAYQGSVRIPMILSGAALGGTRGIRENLTELRDVMPTLLNLAGAPVPPTVEGIDMLGARTREYLHGEHSFGRVSSHYIVTKNDKYIWYSQTGAEHCFNLHDDPREERDLIGSAQARDRVQDLRGLLIEELRDREEGYCAAGRLVVGAKPQNILTQGPVLPQGSSASRP